MTPQQLISEIESFIIESVVAYFQQTTTFKATPVRYTDFVI